MLEINNIESQAGAFRLGPIDLTAPAGSYGVLLGPPGSGKSVLVETLCGLRPALAGQVLIDGQDVTLDEPRSRMIGYVPQDYVLFPKKTVLENIIFGLCARGMEKTEACKSIEWVVDLLHIQDLLPRWPATLSGGEQQRVALARALAFKPRLLLLDEPVSALDEGLRERVCRDLRHFQRELGITTIHISHNLEEALAVSDWAAILSDGKLLQFGPMGKLLRQPQTETVARFLRSENIFSGTAERATGGQTILNVAGHRMEVNGSAEGAVTFMIRPENVTLHSLDESPQPNRIRARLVQVADRGAYQRLEFQATVPIIVFAPNRHQDVTLSEGEDYQVEFPADAIHFLELCP